MGQVYIKMKRVLFIISQSNKTVLLLLGVVIIIVNSCKREESLTHIVSRIQGTNMMLPSEMLDSESSSMTIINYVDSLGCVKCKLQLEKWKAFQSDLYKMEEDVGILFIVHPSVFTDVKLLMDISDFQPNITMEDKGNQWVLINNIPKNDLLHTFLLDNEGKVLLVGNPIRNKKIAELFFKILKERKKETKQKGSSARI